MKISGVPFGVTDWSTIAAVEYPGTTGKALWRTREFAGMVKRVMRCHDFGSEREARHAA